MYSLGDGHFRVCVVSLDLYLIWISNFPSDPLAYRSHKSVKQNCPEERNRGEGGSEREYIEKVVNISRTRSSGSIYRNLGISKPKKWFTLRRYVWVEEGRDPKRVDTGPARREAHQQGRREEFESRMLTKGARHYQLSVSMASSSSDAN